MSRKQLLLLAPLIALLAGPTNATRPHIVLVDDIGYHSSITGKVHSFSNLNTENPATDYGFALKREMATPPTSPLLEIRKASVSIPSLFSAK